jgi:hypothetical protein
MHPEPFNQLASQHPYFKVEPVKCVAALLRTYK